MDYRKKYKEWLENPFFDEETKAELKEIEQNENEIQDRFYQDLSFGTAGLRGILGAGTNRMNRYTVGKATQGLANFIKKEGKEESGVAISYDSRHMSKEFSQIAALCLNANGIKTYVFESLRPVPELSYAVRRLGCTAGIMITASHNPPKYNGYKVYWEDGAQITAPKDQEIMQEVNYITDYTCINSMEKEEAIEKDLYHVIGEEIDKAYMEELKKQMINPEMIKKQKDLSIVYTPLHGAGNVPVQRILKEIGFENVHVVPEQEKPDGDFPTVDYPNPEDKKAFALALALAEKVEADVVLATDPDADRLGVYAKDSKTGEYKAFTGNMSAIILLHYILSQKQEKNELPVNGAVIKSIVSSTMTDAIAKQYGMKVFDVLTGFKYIGEKIKEFEKTKEYTYIFGFEESYGCLVGTHARDKDAIVAVMMLCEAAAFYKEQGMTLWDEMLKLYETYGYYQEETIQITLEGANGAEQMQAMIDKMRDHSPEQIGGLKVKKIKDYEKQTIIEMESKVVMPTGLPKSNVLYYILENDAWCCMRPSGTEPKIKFYVGVKEKTEQEAKERIEKIIKDLK